MRRDIGSPSRAVFWFASWRMALDVEPVLLRGVRCLPHGRCSLIFPQA